MCFHLDGCAANSVDIFGAKSGLTEHKHGYVKKTIIATSTLATKKTKEEPKSKILDPNNLSGKEGERRVPSADKRYEDVRSRIFFQSF